MVIPAHPKAEGLIAIVGNLGCASRVDPLMQILCEGGTDATLATCANDAAAAIWKDMRLLLAMPDPDS